MLWGIDQGDKLGSLVNVHNWGKQYIRDEGQVKEGRRTQVLCHLVLR